MNNKSESVCLKLTWVGGGGGATALIIAHECPKPFEAVNFPFVI